MKDLGIEGKPLIQKKICIVIGQDVEKQNLDKKKYRIPVPGGQGRIWKHVKLGRNRPNCMSVFFLFVYVKH